MKVLEQKLKFVGGSYAVQDAQSKVTGETVYISDQSGPSGTLHVALVLSRVGHGRILHMDTAQAELAPGVVKIYTHENTPKTCYNSYRTVPEQACCPEDQRILADCARYVGDRVAAVVAASREAAEQAARLVRVEYEPLPVLPDAPSASAADAHPIHAGGNIIGECAAEHGQPATHGADTITVESTVAQQKMYHAAMENHVYLADYDGQRLTLHTPTQGVYGIRTVVADYLGLPYARVRIIKATMGGSFGGKQEFLFEPLLAYIAKDLRRSVRLALSRHEDIISTMVRGAHHFHLRTVFHRSGSLLECNVEDLFDGGAYAGSSLDQAYAMLKKVTRQYRVPRYTHHTTAVYTNSVPAGGMRGWGSPEVFTAMEIHMARAARVLGMDQVSLRIQNMVQPFDVEPLSGVSLGNCRATDCMTRGAALFGWAERAAQPHGDGRFLHGVGVACGAHKNGMFGGSPDVTTMTLKMNEDGTLNLIACLHEVGCGTLRSMQIIVAEVLDTPPDSIFVTEGDTETTPFDAGTYGSRVTYIAGRCAQRTAEALRERLLDYAAILLERERAELSARNGGIGTVDGTAFLPYRALATGTLLRCGTDLAVTHTYLAQDNPGVYSAHFAEVLVDTLTGLVRITKYVAAQDVGQAINRGMVEGQIQGGVQMGIGYALCEDLCLKPDGTPTNDSFKKYHIINMYDMPRVEVELIEDGEENGPFGAKSVGEIATVPAAAAVVNAVNDALGTDMTVLPLTPERIVAELVRKKETKAVSV